MKTTRQQQDATRRQIVASAVDLMTRQGFDGTTMKDIARAAGIGDADDHGPGALRHPAHEVEAGEPPRSGGGRACPPPGGSTSRPERSGGRTGGAQRPAT